MRPELRPSAMPSFSGSYAQGDVTFLLRPIAFAPTPVDVKERLIQSGKRHYSEMLSPESLPDARYMALFAQAELRTRTRLAQHIVDLAAALAQRCPGRPVVLASLARAGTPISVLLRRQLVRMGVSAPHYSISIIRDRGIDREALAHMAARHDPRDIVFIDGWTGKGAIAAELRASLAGAPFGIRPTLAVIADPAGVADIAATCNDDLIASGLLNAIVSGLVSRSILSEATVRPGDFHACVYYPHWRSQDLSRPFVDRVDAAAAALQPRTLAGHNRAELASEREAMLREVEGRADVADRNRIKPGIAEATRAFLRRVPERLFVRDPGNPDVAHLMHLAETAAISVDALDTRCRYRAVAVIGRAP